MESELASMWVQVAKFREYGNSADDTSSEVVHSSEILHTRVRNGFLPSNDHPNMFQNDRICKNIDTVDALEDLRAKYHEERSRCIKLERYISRLKVWTSVPLLQCFHIVAPVELSVCFSDELL